MPPSARKKTAHPVFDSARQTRPPEKWPGRGTDLPRRERRILYRPLQRQRPSVRRCAPTAAASRHNSLRRLTERSLLGSRACCEAIQTDTSARGEFLDDALRAQVIQCLLYRAFCGLVALTRQPPVDDAIEAIRSGGMRMQVGDNFSAWVDWRTF